MRVNIIRNGNFVTSIYESKMTDIPKGLTKETGEQQFGFEINEEKERKFAMVYLNDHL